MFNIYQSREEFIENNKEQYEIEKSKQMLLIKKFNTVLSKRKFQDLLDLQKRYTNCQLECYSQFKDDFKSENRQQLLDCKNECKQPLYNLQNFLDQINYLSEKKMKNCTNRCYNQDYDATIKNPEIQLNNCNWVCYNKLDRRYRVYWTEQRDGLKKKFM
ncbi:hypothetical protein PPERSA_09111 [Pseudocohnilembus persalinus]|uniref:Uncharacterized protein n=1 Tax=Pseudocohnilembus persalinus TaxID=266149 RepID=A0A0V0QXU9_PSEPJ|nr:hypothetical protein PPERSA_09111 [Pseudocohnilembus persalinus]|eukprot:KRX06709.1 hypothetical protein PPERSA_09111 [Pseudocohnilembus persalinus]